MRQKAKLCNPKNGSYWCHMVDEKRCGELHAQGLVVRI